MQRNIVSLAIGLMLATNPATAEPPKLIAEQITPANAAVRIQAGPDAAGGIGDWALSNGTLCATVSNTDHESDLSASGGALIDLGYCDRADDQFVSTQDLRDGSTASPIDMQHVYARLSPVQAAIISTGGEAGLQQEVQFVLDHERPTALRIRKRISRRRDSAPDFHLLAPIFFNYYSMETFLLSSTDPSRTTGFSQIGFSAQGLQAFTVAARNLDTIVALGAPQADVPVSYGWQLRSATKIDTNGETVELPRFAAADAGASAFLVLSDPFFVGNSENLGLTQMLQIALMGLAVGEELQLEEVLYVGRNDDVASITDQLYAAAPWRAGRVDAPRAVIHVDRATGTANDQWTPFTFVRPQTDGHFQVRLPDGVYRLTATAAAGVSVSATTTLEHTTARLPELKLPAAAVVALPRGEPMRLVFQGLNGTPDPDLQNTLTGYEVQVDGKRIHPPGVPMVFLAGVDDDRSELALPPGEYRVYATRGIEYSLTQVDIRVQAGTRQRLNIAAPQRAVASPGFIAADLHVHSGPSMDNGFAPRERVRTFVAEHGEVMVATEHETLFDFKPLIRSMGLSHRIQTVTGTEMTGQVRTARMPYTVGHANFFPLTPDPTAFRRGVPANEDRRLREVLYDVRRMQTNVLTQLNHARGNDQFLQAIPADPSELIDDGAYLDHMGPTGYPYDPRKPLSSAPNQTLTEADPVTGVRDLDFDAMEILNGAHDYAPTRRRALMADWMSLLLQGERITGTANSDSHGKSQQVALPRNMVAVTDDQLSAFAEDTFIEAIRGGHSYGTTGPLLELQLSDSNGSEAGIGDMYRGSTGTLRGKVLTADWIPAEQLRVLVNGEVIIADPIASDGSFAIPLSFQADSFVLIEVEADATPTYATIFPGHRPYAFTNPIYIDANADGRWEPPGLGR